MRQVFYLIVYVLPLFVANMAEVSNLWVIFIFLWNFLFGAYVIFSPVVFIFHIAFIISFFYDSRVHLYGFSAWKFSEWKLRKNVWNINWILSYRCEHAFNDFFGSVYIFFNFLSEQNWRKMTCTFGNNANRRQKSQD